MHLQGCDEDISKRVEEGEREEPRIGKKLDGQTRPLKVTLFDKELRDSGIIESKKLNASSEYKHVNILPDRPQEERERIKSLVEDVKKRNEETNNAQSPRLYGK